MGNSNGTPVLRPEDIEVLSKTSGKNEEEVKIGADSSSYAV